MATVTRKVILANATAVDSILIIRRQFSLECTKVVRDIESSRDTDEIVVIFYIPVNN